MTKGYVLCLGVDSAAGLMVALGDANKDNVLDGYDAISSTASWTAAGFADSVNILPLE